MTISARHADLCDAVDGQRRRQDILALTGSLEDREAAAAILDGLERIGFIVSDGGPVTWLGPESPDLLRRLSSLRDGPARGMVAIPARDDSPFSTFAAPSRAAHLPPHLATWGGAAGTGLGVRSAAIACLFEVAERCSQMRVGDEARKIAAFGELRGLAVHPDDLLLAGNGHAARPTAGSTPIRPFDETERIAWASATDLASGCQRWLPEDYCYRSVDRTGPGWTCPADSGGCASGSSMADVVVRGFLEVVERDAVAIWWFNRLRRPAWPVEAAGGGPVGMVSAWQAHLGRRFHLLDLTTDLGIPVIAAVSCDASGRRIAAGFGAHFDPVVAAIRASLEMIQFQAMIEMSLGYRDRGSVKEVSPATSESWRWFETVAIESEPYLVPGAAEVASPRVASPATGDTALDRCIEIAADHGLDLLFLDMTRTWIGIPVGRVMVPGLRSVKPRFGAGRLYDVPVKLGWRSTATATVDFNARDWVF